MQNKDFYVYIHYRKTDEKPFYVGKGRGDRHLSKDRNPHWKRTVAKHGYESVIVYDGLSEQEAFDLEIETIHDLRMHGAPLTNMTAGGIGGNGAYKTDEEKSRLLKIRRAKGKDPRIGIKRSPEVIQKVSKALTGKKQSFSTKLKRAMNARDEKHPRYNPKTYDFYNYETGEVAALSLHNFCKYTRLPKSNVYHMVNGDLITVGRWTIKGRDLSQSRPVNIVHVFYHPEHGEVTCTLNDLKNMYGVPLSNMSSVVSGKRKRCKGWEYKGPSLGQSDH